MIKGQSVPLRLAMLAALAGGLLASGCSKGTEENQVQAEASNESEVNIPIPEGPAVPAIRDVPNTSAVEENLVAPPEEISQDEQMIEDAEATGMTSRSNASDESTEPSSAGE